MEEQIRAIKFGSLEYRMRNMSFSWRKASVIVGGEMRLQRLMDEGKVRYSKNEGRSSNTSWCFNAVDIINNVKPFTKELNSRKK